MALGEPYVIAQSNTTATVFTNATEVVAITSPLMASTIEGGAGNWITGVVTVTTGATGTGGTLKVRTGSGIAGTQVFTQAWLQPAAANTVSIPFAFLDSAPSAAGGTAQYTVTFNANVATATGVNASIGITPAGFDS
jgi:hypothetical protein